MTKQNELLFKTIMRRNGDTMNTLADYLCITRVSLHRKMNAKYRDCFNARELAAIYERYNKLSDRAIFAMFIEGIQEEESTLVKRPYVRKMED